MFRKPSETKTLSLLTVIMLSIFASFASTHLIPDAKASASYTGAAKPMEFYFHYIDIPVTVGGLQTKYIMNTTRWFNFLTAQEAYANAFFKSGLAKSTFQFCLYPNFAGPVTINGSWQVLVWLNSTAQHPVGFKVRFYEITVDGTQLWDSGTLTPTVTSSGNPGYIDVPVHNYNLAAPLNHQFSSNTTLEIEVEITTGTASDLRFWYDSPLYPSKAILPAQDYARPVSVKTYAYDNSETNMFNYNWSENQRVVMVRANVTDPFGGYDVNRVNMTILDPSNNPVVDNVDMVRKSDGQWLICFSHTYEANWTYPSEAQLGNYTVNVSVIDNNGYYRNLDTGFFSPFIEYNDHIFSIGIIVYYNPAFLVVDDAGAPLPNAQVFITWPNGSMDALPRYTAANGFINLTHVLPATYRFTILWKDVVVKQEAIYADSDGPYTIKTEVYQLTVQVLGNDRVAVHGAYIIVYAQTGVGYGLDTTDMAGQAVFKLPRGTYNIEAYYTAEYWLKVVSTSATEQNLPVNASTSKTIVLTEFPPPIWITTGFWLLLALVAFSALAAIYIVFMSRRRAFGTRKRA